MSASTSDKSNTATSHARFRSIRYAVAYGKHQGQIRPTRQSECIRHGLAAVQQRRVNGALTQDEQGIRTKVLTGLLADKGGEAQISTAMHVLAEIIASDVSLLVTFNKAIEGVIQNNPKARANPKALAQLNGYKRPLVGSLSTNFQRFGMEKISKVESLREINEEMSEDDETYQNLWSVLGGDQVTLDGTAETRLEGTIAWKL